jgi:alpha-D-ribose 1-methylphosphonate 5-triphosphate synthase subunit PhnH
MDFETPFWTDLAPDSPEVQWLKFHTGAPVTFDPFDAAFALITDTASAIDLNRFNPGTVISPDRSTTLVIQTLGMAEGDHLRLTGPGIPTQAGLTFTGIAPDFWEHRSRVNQSGPTGIDLIFVHKDRFCALPRTTQTEVS